MENHLITSARIINQLIWKFIIKFWFLKLSKSYSINVQKDNGMKMVSFFLVLSVCFTQTILLH